MEDLDPATGGLGRNEDGSAGIRSIAIPALGCGYGELDWADVLPLLTDTARRLVAVSTVELYEPHEDVRALTERLEDHRGSSSANRVLGRKQ